MDKELEIMTVDGVDYAILKEVKNVGTTYVFLSNVANSEDGLFLVFYFKIFYFTCI